jgi:hypothetical protein
MMVKTAIITMHCNEFMVITEMNDAEDVVGAVTGLRTGADGDVADGADGDFIGADEDVMLDVAGASVTLLASVGTAGAIVSVSSSVGAATGVSTMVGTAVTGASTGTSTGASTGTSTEPSDASNVHVLGQLIITKHSQGKGNVTVVSPGVYPNSSSSLIVALHVPHGTAGSMSGKHVSAANAKSAKGQVTLPIPVKFEKVPDEGGKVGRSSLKYSHESGHPLATKQSQTNGMYRI